MASWLGNVESARNSGRALWCDDLPLREVARSLGVRAFGTVELANFAQSAGTVTGQEDETLRLALLMCGASYLDPTYDELRLIASIQGWTPRAVALLIADPTLWSNNAETVFEIYTEALDRCEGDVQFMATWTYQAGHGISRATDSDGEGLSVFLARLLIRGTTNPATVAAAQAGLHYSCPDLLKMAWPKALRKAYAAYLRVHEEGSASQLLLRLVNECPSEFRLEALQVILGPRTDV